MSDTDCRAAFEAWLKMGFESHNLEGEYWTGWIYGYTAGQSAAVPQIEPVTQTILGPHGNCMAACFSTLLGVPIDQIPNFFEFNKSDADWWIAVKSWLSQFGLGIVSMSLSIEVLETLPGYLIISGNSVRGLAHATIWKDGKLFHDPYPEGMGLKEIESVDLLYPLNPRGYANNRAMLEAAPPPPAAAPTQKGEPK